MDELKLVKNSDLVTKTVKKYKPEIGMMSCVGVMRDYYPVNET